VAGDSALVFVGQQESGRTDLYEVRLRDGALTQLTNDPCDDDDPTAHPTRPEIVFASDRQGGARGLYHLFSLDLASGVVRQLTSGGHNERQPAWSPDGAQVAFLSDREGIDDLWLWREGRVQRASRFLGPSYNPAWHPSGNALLFAGQAGWEFHLYEVPVAPVDSLWLPEPVDSLRRGPDVRVRAPEPASPYKRHFSMDMAQSVVGLDPTFGQVSGGGMVGLSDVTGNEGVSFFLANNASSLAGLLDGMELGATYFNRTRRFTYGLGLFRLARTYDEDLDLTRYERRVGVSFLGAYPFSRFQRIEGSLVLRYAQDHLLRNGRFVDAWLSSMFLSFVQDNARWTYYGPEGGQRVNLTLGFTRDLSAGQGDYFSAIAEGRKYVSPLRDVVWANRVVLQGSFGDDRANVYVGGPFLLRGYGRRALAGTRTLTLQTELRFPVIGRMRLGFPLPLDFPRISAALFGDAAAAWDRRDRREQAGAVGVGLYMGGGGFPALRVDWVKRTDLSRIEAHTWTYFTLGYNF
jgi:hypothetical protein